MSEFPADTNATAVILRDEGNVRVRAAGRVVYERFCRIKLLSEAGYDHATVHIPYHTGENGQNVHDIEGHTITVSSDSGGVEYHVLKEESIFEEDAGENYKQVRFTLPALEPGAIVEYSYKKTSENPLLLPDWQFQTEEPVLWSEYEALISHSFNYARLKRGAMPYDVKTSKRINLPGQVAAQKSRWVMKDVPALREEPFMTTPDDYRAALEFQLSSYQFPGGVRQNVLDTWGKLAKDLASHPWFGDQLEGSDDLQRQTKRVLTDTEAPRKQMIALYDYVRQNVTWTGQRSVFTDHDLDEVLEAKKGNSAELVFLLTAMLREAGLQAEPVLISTRSNGQIIKEYPIVSQFNDVLVRAVVNGESFLLAPTDPVRPYDLLPPEALNGQGWLAHTENPRWINLQPPRRYHRQITLSGQLAEDGMFKGSLEVADEAYAALQDRHALRDMTEKEFARSTLLSERSNVQVDEIRVSNEKQVTKPLKIKVNFTIPAYAQAASDYLYAGSFPVALLSENPLRLPDRTFPLNMTFPQDVTYLLNLTLPEGYTVKDLPPTVRSHLSSGGAAFSRLIDEQDGSITMKARYVLARSKYPARVYDQMRSLFDDVISAQNSQIVLQRSNTNVNR